MKPIIQTTFFLLALAACGRSQNQQIKIPVGQPKGTASPHEQVAYFAEGCFWHAELVFQSLVGVRDAVSGYAGGQYANPDYEKVCSGVTGHAESVEVFYDSSVIGYKSLVEAFFASMDPTQVDGQGNDRGTQYRSIAFYTSADQKKIIDEEINALASSGKYSGKIATQVAALRTFYPAEDYHQEYVSQHPDDPYVSNVSIRDWIEFKSNFKTRYKN